MKNWNRFFKTSCAIAVFVIAGLCATSAIAQYAKILPSQGFTTSALPNGWSAPGGWYTDEEYSGTWFWTANGQGGTNGAAIDDIWDYSSTPMSTPSVNVSSYTAPGDSVWVDFDFFWEYNGYDYEYQYDYGYTLDEFEIDANSDVLVSGTTDQIYTYYNTDDYTFDSPQTSSGDWVHYHLLIPVADRTSNMEINFLSNYNVYGGPGLSDAAIDNVTITAYPPPPVPELSLTPKSINFGTATPNSPVTMFANVQNVGQLPLSIINTSFTGSTSYSIVSGPVNGTVVAAGGSVQYGIQFEPFSAGVQNGTFTVMTTGLDSGTQQISLTGVGAVPAVSYSSTNMFRGVNVELTDTSGVQYLYVNSTGQGPLNVNNVSFYGLDAKDYFIIHLPAGAIAVGGVDSIGVRFVPDLEGLPDAHMVIASTAANIPLDTVSLFGVGILPHLAIDSGKSWPLPVTVNFDSVMLGVDSCMTIQLTNPGSDTVAIEKNYFESSDPDFTLTPLTGRDTLIPPGGSQTIRVCFTPVQQGTRLAELRIVTNIPHTETKPYQDTSEFTVNIVGKGVPTGHLSITGPATNGSAATGEPACVQDTLWNTGSVDITVTKVVITGANAADFAPALPPTPFVIAANSTQLFTLCATPSDTGTQTALLTAYGTSNETEDSASLMLSVLGTLVNDSAAISQPFSALTCMGDSDIATITVTNTGNVSTPYTASVSGANASDFTIISPLTSPSESNGGVATFQVQFVPSTNGNETAKLIISGGIGHTITLSATAGSAVIAGTGTAPVTAVDSTSAPFGVTVMNTGTCDWTTGIPTVSAPFNYASGATTIPAGQSATLMFTFSPTASGSFTSPVGFPAQIGVSLPAANVVITGATGSADVQTVSSSNGFSLDQNYPNPFGSSSQLTITLPVGALVNLSIIDVEGKVVQTVLNQHYDAGSFAVTLNANELASGTYYYQMTAGGVTLTRQMVILK